MKLNKMLGFMEEQKRNSASIKNIELLHVKVDKIVRLLSDVTEIQKKNSKMLNQLQKSNEAQAQKEQEEMEKVRRGKFDTYNDIDLINTLIADKYLIVELYFSSRRQDIPHHCPQI